MLFNTVSVTVLFQWLKNKVLVWLKLVYSENRTNIGSYCIKGFEGRLLHFLWETYANLQISQLFNVIIGKNLLSLALIFFPLLFNYFTPANIGITLTVLLSVCLSIFVVYKHSS